MPIIIRQEINLTFFSSTQEKRKLAFFGAGAICRDFLKQQQVFIPDIIIDNNLNGIEVENIPVVSAKSINCWKNYHIIITCAAYKEIEIQLQQENLNEGRDYIKWFDLLIKGNRSPDVFNLYKMLLK